MWGYRLVALRIRSLVEVLPSERLMRTDPGFNADLCFFVCFCRTGSHDGLERDSGYRHQLRRHQNPSTRLSWPVIFSISNEVARLADADQREAASHQVYNQSVADATCFTLEVPVVSYDGIPRRPSTAPPWVVRFAVQSILRRHSRRGSHCC